MEGVITIYEETDDCKVLFQEEGGYLFIHLEIYNWNLSLYRKMKKRSNELFEAIKKRGYKLAFTYSNNKKLTKLWKNIRPISEETTFDVEGEVFYMAAWDLED